MFKVQTLNKIATIGLDYLPRENYEITTETSSPDAILLRSFKMHDMELPTTLQAIGRAGAGVNNIPLDKCSEKGIVVFNTPGANANGVKEMVLASLFLSSRDIVSGVQWAKGLKSEGDMVPKLVESGKSNFAGNEIKGKKLGVIGLGAIGVMVANDAIALGMDVIGYDPFISVEAAWSLSSEVERANALENLLSKVDYITLHLPLLPQTKGMLNDEKFAMMKDGVKILNFARGGLVDNIALKVAITRGKVDRYVTDFPDVELLGEDKIIPVPHLGASTNESEDNCAIMAARQLKDFLEDGNITNSVNFPNCKMLKTDSPRLIVANKNIPKMVSQITTLLADENVNIADMINKSKGDYAYNIIDIDGEITEEQIILIDQLHVNLLASLENQKIYIHHYA